MKKIIRIIILIIGVGLIVFGGINLYKDYKIEKAERARVKEIISRFTLNNNYNIDNNERYVAYYDKNPTVSIDHITVIVNKGIDKENVPYSEMLVNIIQDKYFIKQYLNRYLAYGDINKKTRDIVSSVNANVDQTFYTNVVPTDMTKDNLIIVNKFHYVDQNYVPQNLVKVSNEYNNNAQLDSLTYSYFVKMAKDAKKEGLIITINSGYRSYKTQQGTYNYYVKLKGLAGGDACSARPGYSEHQTGLAIDLGVTNKGYANYNSKDPYRWIMDNCYKYGFILRYPNNKTNLTGYVYEPWHYRYVGIDTATYIHENKITYDEYYTYFILNKGQ